MLGMWQVRLCAQYSTWSLVRSAHLHIVAPSGLFSNKYCPDHHHTIRTSTKCKAYDRWHFGSFCVPALALRNALPLGIKMSGRSSWDVPPAAGGDAEDVEERFDIEDQEDHWGDMSEERAAQEFVDMLMDKQACQGKEGQRSRRLRLELFCKPGVCVCVQGSWGCCA